MSTRRIERLEIEGLFGRFNYTIDLSVKEGSLKILTAPNGYGKSTILRAIDALARGDYKYFARERFNNIKFFLSDESIVEIIRKDDGVSINYGEKSVIINGGEHGGKRRTFFNSSVADLKKVASRILFEGRERNTVEKERFFELYDDIQSSVKFLKQESWLEEVRESLSVLSISTNRLKSDIPRLSERSDNEFENAFTVDFLAEVVKTKIRQEIGRQFNKGRQLEASFPARLIEAIREPALSPQKSSVAEAINLVKDYEARFAKLGLVPKTGSEAKIKSFKMDSLEGPGVIVLETYLGDILTKFTLLDELARKLEVFCDSINELLAFKTVSTSADDGIIVRVSDREDESVPLNLLSSGEQHLIVIIGELVFNADEDSLVLIDEPEISFHPEWQERFIGILEKIQQVNSFSVLVSTHSPMLIGDRWDRVIELSSQYEGGKG